MSRRVQLILAALVVAGLGLWWWKGGSSAEREVRALFEGFLEASQKP